MEATIVQLGQPRETFEYFNIYEDFLLLEPLCLHPMEEMSANPLVFRTHTYASQGMWLLSANDAIISSSFLSSPVLPSPNSSKILGTHKLKCHVHLVLYQ